MDTILLEFEAYLFQEKKMAKNSLQAYRRDIRGFMFFLEDKHLKNYSEVNNATIVSYILYLKKEGRTTATINRKIASVRALFNFLIKRGDIKDNPVSQIKTPKVEKKEPEYLSVEDVECLLSQPDGTTKGSRDRAILELMYATGMRVSEIIKMDINDINFKMGFAVCGADGDNGRIIPMGKICREAVFDYIENHRLKLINDSSEEALFVNVKGLRLSRQGLWKIIKHYAEKAGIKKKITPQILRHSFAVHMIQNGADIKSLQELLGHGDVAATQVYLLVNKNRIKDVYEKAHPRAF